MIFGFKKSIPQPRCLIETPLNKRSLCPPNPGIRNLSEPFCGHSPLRDALKIRSYIMINIGAFMTKNPEAGLTIAHAALDERFWICHPAGTIEEGTAVNQ